MSMIYIYGLINHTLLTITLTILSLIIKMDENHFIKTMFDPELHSEFLEELGPI